VTTVTGIPAGIPGADIAGHTGKIRVPEAEFRHVKYPTQRAGARARATRTRRAGALTALAEIIRS